jgi:uncharacterized protein YndB with AHSA1/START domain
MTTQLIEPVKVAVFVNVTAERAWQVFTEDATSWWPLHSHSVLAEEGKQPQAIVIEGNVGGEIYEQLGAVRHHWARIHTWEPPSRLAYTWRVNPAGPATEVAISFSAEGAGTRVEVVHSGWEAYADHADEMRANYGGDQGWNTVLGCFERYFCE